MIPDSNRTIFREGFIRIKLFRHTKFYNNQGISFVFSTITHTVQYKQMITLGYIVLHTW